MRWKVTTSSRHSGGRGNPPSRGDRRSTRTRIGANLDRTAADPATHLSDEELATANSSGRALSLEGLISLALASELPVPESQAVPLAEANVDVRVAIGSVS